MLLIINISAWQHQIHSREEKKGNLSKISILNRICRQTYQSGASDKIFPYHYGFTRKKKPWSSTTTDQ